MSEIVRVPPELQRFLGFPGPQALLIRGPPGSGKTTLGLACLEEFRGDRVLVTSRVPHRELGREFPWLGNHTSHQISVIDTSESTRGVHEVARTIQHLREGISTTDDPEMDLKFKWLPAPIRTALAGLGPSSPPTLIVIDSWDALVEQFLGDDGSPSEGPVPDRGYLERLLLRFLARSPAHLIFILEREEQSQLDYLVNGVIVTHREPQNERLERWLTILKLRGVRIENPVYPFTLEGSRFMTILPAHPYSEDRGGGFDKRPDQMPGHIWPGSATFAEIFGRLPFGRMTLIERGPDVASRAWLTLVLPMIEQVLLEGGRVLAIPPPTSTPEEIYAPFEGRVEKGTFVAQVRLIMPSLDRTDPDLGRIVTPLSKGRPGNGFGTSSGADLVRFLTEGATASTPSFLLLDLEGLSAIAAAMGVAMSPEAVQQLPLGIQTAIRKLSIHAVVVGQTDSPLAEPFRRLASSRLRMWTRQGRLFLHGTEPWTPTLVLTGGGATHPYDLVRIV